MPKKRSTRKTNQRLALIAFVVLVIAASTLLICGPNCCFNCGSSPTGAVTGAKEGSIYEYFYNGTPGNITAPGEGETGVTSLPVVGTCDPDTYNCDGSVCNGISDYPNAPYDWSYTPSGQSYCGALLQGGPSSSPDSTGILASGISTGPTCYNYYNYPYYVYSTQIYGDSFCDMMFGPQSNNGPCVEVYNPDFGCCVCSSYQRLGRAVTNGPTFYDCFSGGVGGGMGSNSETTGDSEIAVGRVGSICDTFNFDNPFFAGSGGGAVCGNGVVNSGEACDDGNTNDCDGCKGDCSRAQPTCGDGIVECIMEQCDGAALGGGTCSGQGYSGGTLACTGSCTFDTTNCYTCGNAVCESAKGENNGNCPTDCLVCPSGMSGSGTKGSPCMITTCTQLQAMNQGLSLSYALGNNIDCTGVGFTSVGGYNTPFNGELDGRNHTIINLNITVGGQPYDGWGMFGYVGGGATKEFKNFGIVNGYLSSTVADRCGLLYAMSLTQLEKVDRVFATGTVNCPDIGGDGVGGLIGAYGGYVNNSWTNVNVTAWYRTGGISGESNTKIYNSYAIGPVTGFEDATHGPWPNTGCEGGLIGRGDNSAMVNSFATGLILSPNLNGYTVGILGYTWGPTTITDCYYLNRAEEPLPCSGYSPLTCTAIQGIENIGYFYDTSNAPMSSWDFTNVWSSVCDGVGYPPLKWQGVDDVYDCPGHSPNTAPVIDSVTLAPAEPADSDDLTATVTAHDDDDITYAYNWYAGETSEPGETPVTDGRVAYWPLDSDTNDHQGASHLTNYGATPASGKSTGAYTFDGINDFMRTDTITQAFNLPDHTTSVWIKSNKNGIPGGPWEDDNRAILATANNYHGDYQSWAYNMIWVDVNGSVGHYHRHTQLSGIGDPHDFGALTAPGMIQTGNWYHIVSIMGSGGNRLYVNGVKQTLNYWEGSESSPYAWSDTNSGQGANFLTLGEIPYWPTYAYPFNGTIDEPMVFNRALSDSEIQQLYGGGAWRLNATSLITNGLVAYYPLDNDIRDYWGSNDGTATGVPTQVAGQVDSAYDFNGVGDYITTSDNDLLNGATALSMSFWISADTFTSGDGKSWDGIISDREGDPWSGVTGYEDKLYFCVDAGPYDCAGHSITFSEWHHVVGTWKSGEAIKLYIDGAGPYVSPTTITGVISQAQPWVLGYDTIGPWYDRYFNGKLDEVMFFNRALTAAEVQKLYYGSKYGGDVMGADKTAIGDKWAVGVKAGDYLLWSDESMSNNVTVAYLAPVASVDIVPPSPTSDDTLKGYCSATSDSNHNLTYYWKWFKNSILNASGGESMGGIAQCYQETANVATACGGLATGSYTGPDLWSDGNWSTWTTALNIYSVVYTKPAGAQATSFWRVKDSKLTANLTIPSSCWNYDANSIRFYVRVYNGGCFLPGTKVLMADGSYKPIEELSVGDYVMSYDNTTEKNVASRVTKTISNTLEEAGPYYVVVNNLLRVTPSHKFLLNGEWRGIGEAKVGDYMTDINGSSVMITNLTKVYEKSPTYNIEVEGTHNYYPAGLMVHNVCFLDGTKVLMADGTRKDIEDISIGDYVASYDEETGERVSSRVTGTISHTPAEMGDHYLIVNGKMRVTPNHPVLLNGEWREIGSAKIGDHMTDINGSTVAITSIDKVYKKAPTYNLEVDGTHTYYAEDLLVHNKGVVTEWYCKDSTGTYGTRLRGVMTGPAYPYEEGMWWNISTPRASHSSGVLVNLRNISASSTIPGQSWTFACLAYDGQANSSWANASVMIAGVCGNSIVESGEECDGGACCSLTCLYESSSTVCRASAGDCDLAETCTGSSATCPADIKSTAVCRASAGQCDVLESCDGVNDACPANSFQPVGTSCDDSIWCNTGETCSADSCQGGSAMDCSDGITCSIDSCNEANDVCDHDITGCECNDSSDCDDSNQCTDDTCTAQLTCVATNDDTNACNDGEWCTIGDSCASGVCASGSRDCSDTLSCTTDSCNETADVCLNIEIDIDRDAYSLCGNDCDDLNSAINPSADELYNSIDDDCDTFIDEGFVVGSSGYGVTVGDNMATDGQKFTGDQDVVFSEDGQVVMEFTHDFDESNLDLSDVTIETTRNSILVNMHGQLLPRETKTLSVEDNGFNTLCIKDAEVASISAVSRECNGADEMIFNRCLHNAAGITLNGITCIDLGDTIKVSNLRYSAIVGELIVTKETGSEGGASTTYVLTPAPSPELPEPEQPPAEQPPAEQPPEQPPAEQPPAEQQPAIEKPVFTLPSLEKGWYWYVLIIVVFAGVAFSMSKKAKAKK